MQQTTRTTLHQNPTRGQGLAVDFSPPFPCSLQCKELRQSFCLGAHFVMMFVYRRVPAGVLKFLLWTGKYQYENSPFFFASSLHFFLVFVYNNFKKNPFHSFYPSRSNMYQEAQTAACFASHTINRSTHQALTVEPLLLRIMYETKRKQMGFQRPESAFRGRREEKRKVFRL